MAVSKIKRDLKIRDLWVDVGKLTWSSSGVWFSSGAGVEINGQVLAVTVTNWSELPSVTVATPYLNDIIFMCNSKPNASARAQIRIVEEV